MKPKYVVIVPLLWLGITPIGGHAFENLSQALTSDQQACFSMAMVGMDSVINARLGVPAEHALELSRHPSAIASAANRFNHNLLNVILDAYLWENTPHSYAISVFYGCAAQTAYRQQAKFD